MKLTKEQLAMLETPCVILDVVQARRNIEAMQAAADAAGCALRPHIKTHKMAVFARMQVEAGAQGITCAKVSEAETISHIPWWEHFVSGARWRLRPSWTA